MAESQPCTIPEVVAAASRIAADPGDTTTLQGFAETVRSMVRAHRVVVTLVVWPTLENAGDTVALAYRGETGTDPPLRPSPVAITEMTAAGHTQSVHSPPSLSSRVLSAPVLRPGNAKAHSGDGVVAFFFSTGTKRLAAVLETEAPQDQLALPLSRDRFHTALAPILQTASAAWSAKLFADLQPIVAAAKQENLCALLHQRRHKHQSDRPIAQHHNPIARFNVRSGCPMQYTG